MSTSLTKFWSVSFSHRETEDRWTLIVQAPAEYSEEKLCSTLQAVHPEYEGLSAEEIERPAHIKAWGEEDTLPPPPADPELEPL